MAKNPPGQRRAAAAEGRAQDAGDSPARQEAAPLEPGWLWQEEPECSRAAQGTR